MALVCCPRNLSFCCMILSVWGVVQLALMGVFFYFHSVAFVEDIPATFDEENADKKSDAELLKKFLKDVDDGYESVAINCWIAAGIYVVFFVISLQQFKARTSS